MNKFLQQSLASFLGSVAGLFFFFALGTAGLLVFLITLLASDATPPLEDKSALVFNLSSRIKDSKSDANLEEIFLEDDLEIISVIEATEAIKKAAEDSRIVALFLDGRKGGINGGYASLNEIRLALEKFKATGKKIIAYNLNYGEKDYYVSSVADSIIINPMGLVEINGFSSPQLFFADALNRYGIGVQVIRAGKFKAAVEPFIRNNYSDESKQQTKKLLTDLWSNYLQTVSNSRSLSPEDIQNIADNKPILNPEEAQKLGLIDRIAYFDEVVTILENITDSEEQDSFPKISIKKYLEATKKTVNPNNKIAVLYAEGTIVIGKGGIGQVGSNRFSQQLQKIRENDQIRAVILRINSPGGSAIASEIILRELQLTAKKKPIVVSMGNLAASGGYWIATGGEKIFANNSTITGSIGVFGLLFNLEEIANNNGINYDVVKTGKFADLTGGLRPKTEEELKIYQQSVDRFYNLFLEKVAKARNLSPEKVDPIAQGRTWSGENAKNIGLVDEIGGLETAIQYVVNKLDLGDDWQIEEYPEKRSWETEIMERLSEAKMQSQLSDHETIALAISKLKSTLDFQEVLQDPDKIYTILPFKLEIE
jgi:protease-4